MPLGSDSLSLPVYRRTLEVLYPVVSSWEQWSAANAPARFLSLLAARKRSPMLAADLRELGGVSGEPLSLRWDEVTGQHNLAAGSEAEAGFLGALYVMEGSTLGGRFIAKHVEAVLGLEPGRGDAYFRGHGESTGSMWKQVMEHISQVDEEFAPVTTAAARRTFITFRKAMEAGLDACEPQKL